MDRKIADRFEELVAQFRLFESIRGDWDAFDGAQMFRMHWFRLWGGSGPPLICESLDDTNETVILDPTGYEHYDVRGDLKNMGEWEHEPPTPEIALWFFAKLTVN